MNKSATLIDTSNMSKGERAALEMAEDSRDSRPISGFAASLFNGRPQYDRLHPFPAQTLEDADQGDAFLTKLNTFLQEKTDPDTIDREGEIPDDVISGLAEIGAFGIKIPRRYGGLGLSQTNYSRAAMLLGSHCGNLTALLSAHQSIGVPQPLLVFGTDEQKQRFLPKIAAGSISAFALTESDVGSDPARMKTTATPTSDGKHFAINGEKLWCTNLLKAKYLVVMAKTPIKDKPNATTAFIVATDSPGVEIIRRCHFMGLKALYNGVVRFDNVLVPADQVIHEVGKGLKVALTTLNTGRLTLPAACTGMMNRLLKTATNWSRKREQWGAPIGQHAAIAAKIADLAADQFATESMVLHTSALVDSNKKADVRLEAAMAKLWGTEAAWNAIYETMQIRGGRGYETADSLRARGKDPAPIERMMRDSRINTIFEGSSEIMRLFIAREALDPHLRRAAAALDSRKPTSERLASATKAGAFYVGWYPARYFPTSNPAGTRFDHEWSLISTHSRQLSRRLFRSMAQFGPKLDKQQLLLGRYVDIACELYAMACSVARAAHLESIAHPSAGRSQQIAKFLCRRGHHRINRLFYDNKTAPDQAGYTLARDLLKSLEN